MSSGQDCIIVNGRLRSGVSLCLSKEKARVCSIIRGIISTTAAASAYYFVYYHVRDSTRIRCRSKAPLGRPWSPPSAVASLGHVVLPHPFLGLLESCSLCEEVALAMPAGAPHTAPDEISMYAIMRRGRLYCRWSSVPGEQPGCRRSR